MIFIAEMTARQLLALTGLAFLLLVIAAVVYSWDDIKRYIRMKRT